MAHQIVNPPDAAQPMGPYALSVLVSGTRRLEISGALAIGADGSRVGGDDAEAQARQCLANIDACLRAAGATRTDIVRIGVFVTDMADRPAIARARLEYFGDWTPCATMVQIAGLVTPEYKVEIEATAIF